MRKLRSLSITSLVLLMLLAACSSDDDGASTSATTTSTTSQAAGTTTAAGLQVRVRVDFAGANAAQPSVIKTVSVPAHSGATAWDAVKLALGQENIKFTDYGGSLGIFITGLYGVEPSGNSFWEFRINGNSSEVGVSTYIVQDNDDIEFRISS
jgi:hypothetical protein